jgi:hypothetical protein
MEESMRKQEVPYRGAILAAAVAACAMLVVPVTARSQTTCPTANRAKAVRLGKQANVLLGEKKYGQALEGLRAAYALCPEAWVLHAMGCVQEASGTLPEALESFRSCVREAGGSDIGSECGSRAAALEARLKPPAPAPKPVAVAPAPAPVLVAPPPAGHPVPARPPEPGHDAPAQARPSAVWNWVGVGVSVALIGTGVGFLGQYGKDRSDARTSSWVDSQGYTHDPDTVKPTYAIVGGVATGVGVAVLITSVVLWPKAPATVSVAPVPGGGGMVSIGGRW